MDLAAGHRRHRGGDEQPVRFYVDYLFLLQRWATMAGREVASWPSTKNLGLTDGTRQIFADLLAEGERLAGEPQFTVDAENASGSASRG